MSSNNNNDFILWVFVGVAAMIAYAIWQFSSYFGLDMNTGFTVVCYMAGLGFLTYLSYSSDYGTFEIGNTWPILLAALWLCWWPALDYRASLLAVPGYFDSGSVSIWWDAWYTKLGGLVGIAGAGYSIKKLCSD